MCLMSAPAAKNPGSVELTTTARAGLASSASSAASSPSTKGAPSALAGGRSMVMWKTPSLSAERTAGRRSSVAMPVPRAGDEDMARERPPEDALYLARAGDQRLEVDAGLDAHLMEHRHKVLAGDVAGRAGRHGAAPEFAEARLEARYAGLERGQRVGETLPAGVVKVRRQLHAAQFLARACVEVLDLPRVGHPGGVAEADLPRARRGEARGELEHASGVDGTLVRASEGRRDHRRAAQPRVADRGDHLLEARERLRDRAVDVLAVVGLRCAEEHGDLVEALAQLERGLQPARVGHQDRERDVVGHVDALEHRARVVELRDDVGPDEARDLQPLEARSRERVDQTDLVVGRDALGLVLEAVARPDLADAHRRHSLTAVVNLS